MSDKRLIRQKVHNEIEKHISSSSTKYLRVLFSNYTFKIYERYKFISIDDHQFKNDKGTQNYRNYKSRILKNFLVQMISN